MTVPGVMASSIACSLLAIGLVLAVLLPVMRPVLHDICGTEVRVRFWTRMVAVVFFLVSILAVLLSWPREPERLLDVSALEIAVTTTRWVVMGMLVTVCGVGAALASFVQR